MGKLAWVLGGVFGAAGAGLLLAASIASYSALNFRANALRVPGTVVGFDSGKPVVEFVGSDAGSHRTVGAVSSTPPAYDLGERVTVLHPPGRPEEARIDGLMESWFLPTLLGGMGTVFAGLGAGLVFWELRKRRLRDWLHKFGIPVQAKYTGVMLDTRMRVNGRYPWRLTAQWQNPVTGVVHRFASEMLFYDPSDYVERETIEVWIDANDPSRHHLDTAFLPEQAGA
jgi:hypothetical protein